MNMLFGYGGALGHQKHTGHDLSGSGRKPAEAVSNPIPDRDVRRSGWERR